MSLSTMQPTLYAARAHRDVHVQNDTMYACTCTCTYMYATHIRRIELSIIHAHHDHPLSWGRAVISLFTIYLDCRTALLGIKIVSLYTIYCYSRSSKNIIKWAQDLGWKKYRYTRFIVVCDGVIHHLYCILAGALVTHKYACNIHKTTVHKTIPR